MPTTTHLAVQDSSSNTASFGRSRDTSPMISESTLPTHHVTKPTSHRSATGVSDDTLRESGPSQVRANDVCSLNQDEGVISPSHSKCLRLQDLSWNSEQCENHPATANRSSYQSKNDTHQCTEDPDSIDSLGETLQYPVPATSHPSKWVADGFEMQENGNLPPSWYRPHNVTFDGLFLDLIFAAALSQYSNSATLSDFSEVAIFVGFFFILWWSWWSQVVFDVRYRLRQHLNIGTKLAQRLIRCLLLGVWVSYATVTSAFAQGYLQNFTLIYAATKTALIIDYGIILCHLRLHPNSHPRVTTRLQSGGRFPSHLILAGGQAMSLLAWVCSRWASSDNQKIPPMLAMWAIGIFFELTSQVIVERYGSLTPLVDTSLAERMSQFSLIIFGIGFENIGMALNSISPPASNGFEGRAATGGWGTRTVTNAAASVAIVLCLCFGYYNRLTAFRDKRPILMLIWGYLHLALHLASALLVIGLGRIIG